jgi:hypothetical protein
VAQTFSESTSDRGEVISLLPQLHELAYRMIFLFVEQPDFVFVVIGLVGFPGSLWTEDLLIHLQDFHIFYLWGIRYDS